MENFQAVLTGDLIGSTRLTVDVLEAVRDGLLAAVKTYGRRYPGAVEGEPEFFRGDSWQLLVPDPRLSLRMALYLAACLKAQYNLRTRIAIGVGTVDRVTRNRISLSTGEAFVLSGQTLDAMSRRYRFDITGSVDARLESQATWFSVILHLCSGLIIRWTQRQAAVLAAALLSEDSDFEVIGAAQTPPVTKQAVSKVLIAANWRYLLEAVNLFETSAWP